MAARVVTITSGKGGVGKTTATANLAVALAMQEKRVACLDADIGLRNLDVVLGLENRIVYDIVEVVEGRAKLRQAMIRDKRMQEELYLIEAEQKGPAKLVINRVKPDMVKRGDMLSPEDVIDILAIKLIGLVPEDETILDRK